MAIASIKILRHFKFNIENHSTLEKTSFLNYHPSSSLILMGKEATTHANVVLIHHDCFLSDIIPKLSTSDKTRTWVKLQGITVFLFSRLI